VNHTPSAGDRLGVILPVRADLDQEDIKAIARAQCEELCTPHGLTPADIDSPWHGTWEQSLRDGKNLPPYCQDDRPETVFWLFTATAQAAS